MRRKGLAGAAIAGALALTLVTGAGAASALSTFNYGAANCGTGTYPSGLYPTATSTAKGYALLQIGVGGNVIEGEWYDANYTARKQQTTSHSSMWAKNTLDQYTTQGFHCGIIS